MSFRAKVQAKIEKYMPDSDAWGYLPATVKQILQRAGYKRSNFTASVIPADETRGAVAIFQYKRLSPGKQEESQYDSSYILHLSDLKMIEKAGLRVLIQKGHLNLHLPLEDYHGVKEETPA